MRLSANALISFANINTFVYGNQWTIRAGDPNTLYFQLVDLDQNNVTTIPGQSVVPVLSPGIANIPGLRYLAGIGSSNQPYSVRVTFPSSRSYKALCLIATQSDPNDSSIWQVIIPPNLQPSSGNVQFQVFEGQNIRRFSVLNMISVEQPQNDGSC